MKYAHFVLLIPLALYFLVRPLEGRVLGVSAEKIDVVAQETTISTKTAFNQKEIINKEIIPFEIIYREDKNIEYGDEKIIEAGVDGTKKTKYLITYWFEETINKVVSGVEIEKPKDQVVLKGTKVVWRTLDTDVGKI